LSFNRNVAQNVVSGKYVEDTFEPNLQFFGELALDDNCRFSGIVCFSELFIYFGSFKKITSHGGTKIRVAHGFGAFHFKSGDLYIGNWEYGNLRGFIKEYSSGLIHTGTFTSNRGNQPLILNFITTASLPHKGHGKIHYPNGDMYTGEFENGMRHGKGVLRYANGTKTFERHWTCGRPDLTLIDFFFAALVLVPLGIVFLTAKALIRLVMRVFGNILSFLVSCMDIVLFWLKMPVLITIRKVLIKLRQFQL
jgi:hypothetical protein